MTPPARARGFAAISAILVAATVASISGYLFWQGSLAIRQIENIDAARHAGPLVRAAAVSAVATLARDDPRVDHRAEAWARSMPPIEVEGGNVNGTIIDEQAKFNVNNLADSNGVSEVDVAAFRRLLSHVGLPESLADAVVDWIDSDDVVTAPGGAEDPYYLALESAYRTANRHIADLNELLLVKGFTSDRLRRLAPYLTALPGSTKVNVNTTSAELLAAILPGLSEGNAKALAVARDKEPFGSKVEFSQRLSGSAAKTANDLLDVRSDYFVVHGTVRTGRINAGYRALLQRGGSVVLSLSKDFG